MGIITSRTRQELNNDDALSKIHAYFETIICVTDTKKNKPSAEPILAYLDKSEAKPEECLYIGDSVYDSLCAKNAGVDFFLAA